MNMNTDELDSPNNSDNEQLDKTVNDATPKTEEEDSNNTTGIADESPEDYGNSEQIEQTSISDEDSNSSSDMVEQSESLEDPNNLEKMILSTGIRVGTPIKTKFMTSFITRANPEGLYILDISKTLARIDVAAKFIGRTNIANVAVTSAREYGKTPIEKFCELTGARGIFGRFMPGTFTNPSLPKYLEPEIVIVTDPQADEQAVLEATRAGVPVIALSNSDNITSKVDLVIPSNNRGRKALATVYWLLTKEVLKKQGKIKSDSEMPLTIDDFEAKLVEELI
ncbi:30S ribosomal protein S2 [Candidatus Nitrosocosmicus oleophilus]|uniref:Small ribosomal subunit protein uS2 n=1 Tax=Candidatus Nitrosocosmicus oleophilus TaxID=1353260 RepID=A0A654M1F4_9ARCH|nr:30S ribosomal protein S2 [Candidatus Nitrosocosmicus oleophilus]